MSRGREDTQNFLWVAAMIEDERINPARHIKGSPTPPETGSGGMSWASSRTAWTKAEEHTATRPLAKSAPAQMRFPVSRCR